MTDCEPEPAAEAFGSLARRVTTPLHWDDLALEPDAWAQLEEVRRRLAGREAPCVRCRVLFRGPSGTGRTLAAGLLGKATGREVYRVDLSSVVSRFIAETEKNLAALLEAAQHRGWILFFDEADALFGKRTDVRDAHDRYANQEVSTLLQRIEDYGGLVVLAASPRTHIDDAFVRCFDAVVRVALPPEAECRGP